MGFVDLVGVATSYVKADFNLSHSLANILPMMVFVWFALFSIPTGLWMGRHGRRNTVAISLGVTALAMIIPVIHYSFPVVLSAFALLGIGNTILQVSLNPMVAAVVKPDKVASTLTLGQFIKAISSMLGPVLAGCVAATWGDWKLIFPIYSAASLLSLTWLLFAVKPDGVTADDRKQSTSLASVWALLKSKKTLLFFCGILATVGLDVGINTAIPKLMMERCDLPLHEAGFGTSLYFFARTIGAFAGAFILAHTKRQILKTDNCACNCSYHGFHVHRRFMGSRHTHRYYRPYVGQRILHYLYIRPRNRSRQERRGIGPYDNGRCRRSTRTTGNGTCRRCRGLTASLTPLWLCAAYVLFLAFRKH